MSSSAQSNKRIRYPNAGRPKSNIDWDKVDQMIMAGCNATQVAASIGLSVDTLYNRSKIDNNVDFSAYFQESRAKGDGLIHQAQFHKALKEKNGQMLIHLGKHRLGQKDKEDDGDVKINLHELAKLLKSLDISQKENDTPQ